MIEWTPVKSTAIRKIGYELTTRKMYIDFEDSEPYYSFCGVPEINFRQFVSASSIGKYYHNNIKGKYMCY